MSEYAGPTLPHLLRPGLRVVFIGYNPAIYSAEAGHYYARSGNRFWVQLSESGIAGREVRPEDDRLLMDEAGIGFTDLCCRPTVRAEHLTREEIARGVASAPWRTAGVSAAGRLLQRTGYLPALRKTRARPGSQRPRESRVRRAARAHRCNRSMGDPKFERAGQQVAQRAAGPAETAG